jgi:NADPH-dependent curcumin reductase CurA
MQKSYIPPFELNKPIAQGLLRLWSQITKALQGYVSGMLEWKDIKKSDGQGLTKVDTRFPSLPI